MSDQQWKVSHQWRCFAECHHKSVSWNCLLLWSLFSTVSTERSCLFCYLVDHFNIAMFLSDVLTSLANFLINRLALQQIFSRTYLMSFVILVVRGCPVLGLSLMEEVSLLQSIFFLINMISSCFQVLTISIGVSPFSRCF